MPSRCASPDPVGRPRNADTAIYPNVVPEATQRKAPAPASSIPALAERRLRSIPCGATGRPGFGDRLRARPGRMSRELRPCRRNAAPSRPGAASSAKGAGRRHSGRPPAAGRPAGRRRMRMDARFPTRRRGRSGPLMATKGSARPLRLRRASGTRAPSGRRSAGLHGRSPCRTRTVSGASEARRPVDRRAGHED